METPLFPTDIFKDDFDSVYDPSEDTFCLIDGIEKDLQLIKNTFKPLICLEIGCGSGAVITSVAKSLGQNQRIYLATDINEKALLTTQKCCFVNGVNESVQLVRTDMTRALDPRISNSVDMLVFNPPFECSSSDLVGIDGKICATAGGVNGREVIDRFLPITPSLLSPRGVLYMIVRKENNIEEISQVMEGMGFNVTPVLERTGGLKYPHLFVLRFTKLIL